MEIVHLKWTGEQLNASHLREIACKAFMLNMKPGRGKWYPKSTEWLAIAVTQRHIDYGNISQKQPLLQEM